MLNLFAKVTAIDSIHSFLIVDSGSAYNACDDECASLSQVSYCVSCVMWVRCVLYSKRKMTSSQ